MSTLRQWKIMGIDPGTRHIGWAMIKCDIDDETKPVIKDMFTFLNPNTEKNVKVRTGSDLFIIAEYFRKMFRILRPDFLCVEDVVMSRISRNIMNVNNVVRVIVNEWYRYEIEKDDLDNSYRNDVKFVEETYCTELPNAIKETVAGSVKADKDAMRAAAEKYFGVKLNNFDEHAVDALCICIFRRVTYFDFATQSYICRLADLKKMHHEEKTEATEYVRKVLKE